MTRILFTALFCAASIFPALAVAAQFTANGQVDLVDANPGDGACDVAPAIAGEQCTLRAAVMESNALPGADTIVLQPATYTLTRTPDAGVTDGEGVGDLDILDDLTIAGTTTQSSIVDANGIDRVFEVGAGVTVAFRDLTITGGAVDGSGAGISSAAGSLTLEDVVVDSNKIVSDATTAHRGAGVAQTDGNLTISGSTISNNRSEDAAGAVNTHTVGGGVSFRAAMAPAVITDSTIEANDAGRGAGIEVSGVMLVSNTTISSNEAADDGGGLLCAGGDVQIETSVIATNTAISGVTVDAYGGVSGGGGIMIEESCVAAVTDTEITNNRLNFRSDSGFGHGAGVLFASNAETLIIERSSVSDNIASGDGGGLYLGHSGTNSGVENSTVSGNVSTNGSGLYLATAGVAPFLLRNATIAGNNAGAQGPGEGGVYLAAGEIDIHNTVIADNFGTLTTQSDPLDLHCDSGSVTSQGYNLYEASDGTCSIVGSPGSDITGSDPLLGPLQNDGGPATLPPLSGSPLLDAGDNCDSLTGATLTVDQRGQPRPEDGTGDDTATCDIGAHEGGDHGVFVLLSDSFRIAEDGGSLDVTVSRKGGTRGDVSVSYETERGTAEPNREYTHVDGALQFADGVQADKTITIPILDDGYVEPNQTLTIRLLKASGTGLLGDPSSAEITVVDDDGANPGLISLTAAKYTVDENAGIAEIAVNRSAGSTGEVSIDFEVMNDTAQVGIDFDPADGTLIWSDGELGRKSFTVPIYDNSDRDYDRSALVVLSNPSGNPMVGTDMATLEILDDEYLPGVISFSAAEYEVDEGAGSVTLTLHRTDGSDGVVGITYKTQPIDAVEALDYHTVDAALVWADGDVTDREVSVPIIDDDAVESDETFIVTLSDPVGGPVVSQSEVTVLIRDDDVPRPGVLGFVETEIEVFQNADEAAQVEISRTEGITGEVSVEVTTSAGSANPDEHFEGINEILTWEDGEEATKTVIIPLFESDPFEGIRDFEVRLGNPTGDASLGADVAHVAIIGQTSGRQPSEPGDEKDVGSGCGCSESIIVRDHGLRAPVLLSVLLLLSFGLVRRRSSA